MSSIDERIVEMKFNNGQFQKGIDQTAESLDKLKQSLNLEGAGTALEKIASKFNWLSVAGATGLVSLTNAAISAGKSIYDATVGQIITGGEKRSQNFAQAKFQLEGLKVTGKDLKTVMDAASYAVDGTAYGLDQAAVAASSFVASKVPLDQLPSALRAISGVAAMTNRDFGDISQIFTTVAGNGRLMASELNRIGQSGLNAAAALSDYLGVSEEEVRKMTSEGKINFETFAAAMDSAFGEQATKANLLYSGALANVRSALSRIGELPADGKFEKMRLIFVALIPVINSFKKAIVPVLETVRDLQIKSGETIAKFISGIDFSGLTSFFKNIAWAMRDLSGIFSSFGKVVGDIWREVFPKKETEYGVSVITQIGRAISKFTQSLQPSSQTLATFGAALKIVFTALKMVWEGLKLVGEVAWVIIQIIFELAATVWSLIRPLDLTGNVAADSMDSFSSFLEMLIAFREKAIRPLINWLKDLRDGIQGLRNGTGSGIPWLDTVYEQLIQFREVLSEGIPKWFEGAKKFIMDFFDKMNITEKFDGVAQWVKNIDWGTTMETAGIRIGTAWEWVKDLFDHIGEALRPLTENLKSFGDGVKNIFGNLDETFEKVDWWAVLQGMGILGAVALIIKAVMQVQQLTNAVESFAAGWVKLTDSFSNYLDGLTKAQKFTLTAFGILLIAGAIWVLSDAIIRLAQLDWKEIAKGLTVVGLTMAALVGSVYLLSKYMGDKSVIEAAVGMAALAGSLWLIQQVVTKFAKMNPEKLAQGLRSVGLALAGLVGAIILITRLSGDKSIISAAFAMGLIASALYGMALAVGIFALFSPQALEQGLSAVTYILLAFSAMAAGLGNVGGDFIKAAVGIAVITGALYALSLVVDKFAKMPKDQLEKGGVTVIALLAGLSFALQGIAKEGPKTYAAAAAILAMAGAIWVIGDAVQRLGEMDLWSLIKGLGAVVLTMTALVAISQKAQGSIAGAGAIAILAVAILILAYSLQYIEQISLSTIVFGLGAIVLAVIGLAFAAELLAGSKWGLVGAAAIVALLLSIAAVAYTFGYAADMIGQAALNIVQAIQNLGPALKSAADGLVALLTTLRDNADLLDTLGQWVFPLIGLGIALGFLALGAGLLGLALIILAVGMFAISLVGPIATNILIAMIEKLSTLEQYAGSIVVVGGALFILGLGVAMLGLGLIIFSAGLISVAFGLAAIAGAGFLIKFALDALVSSFDAIAASGVNFANAVVEIVDILSQLSGWQVAEIAAELTTLGIALGALGAGALLGGIGLLVLGAGIALMKTSLANFSKVAEPGIKGLQKVVDAIASMIGQVIQLGAMAAAFTGLGASLLLLGAGLMLSGVGGILFATSLMMITAFTPGALTALATLGTGFDTFALRIPTIYTAATAMAKFATDLATAAMNASSVATQLETIAAAIERASTAINTFGESVNSVIPNAISLIGTLPTSTSTAVDETKAAFDRIATGITESTATASTSITTLIDTIKTSLSSGLSSAASTGYNGGVNVGSQTSAGIAAGIRSGSSGVVNAAIDVADRALSAIRKRLDINSPSREGEKIGGFLDKGVEIGIIKNTRGVEKASDQMANGALDGMRSVLGRMSDMIQDSMDNSPTIRPVVDLTDVAAKAGMLGNYFGNEQLNVNGSYNSAAAILADRRRAEEESLASVDGENLNGSSWTFIQNNNSPKALSRAEIYRKTKNQISTAEKRIKGELENAR